MAARNFYQLLEDQWASDKFVCVGLDSEYGKIPDWLKKLRHQDYVATVVDFNNRIVETTMGSASAYKPNIAFYEAYGAEGLNALRHTVQNIHLMAPSIPVILDAKRADIGSTNSGYVEMAFNYLGVDAITVHPYLGGEALQPFLSHADKGIIVLCRTSNPGAGEFQDIQVEMGPILVDNEPQYRPFYQVVARHVSQKWNKNGNCALVVGATYPNELREVREIVGDMPILIPGIGAQGGDLERTVEAGKDSHGQGMIINSSRGIIFASGEADFAEVAGREAEKLNVEINHYLQTT